MNDDVEVAIYADHTAIVATQNLEIFVKCTSLAERRMSYWNIRLNGNKREHILRHKLIQFKSINSNKIILPTNEIARYLCIHLDRQLTRIV